MSLRVAVHIIDGMFESRRCNIVVEASEGLFLVVSEFPNDEGDTNTVRKNRIKIREFIEVRVIHSSHGNLAEALEFGNGDVFE